MALAANRPLELSLTPYNGYYNLAWTHLALNKDAPISRAIQTVGAITSTPFLGGLRHHYVRI